MDDLDPIIQDEGPLPQSEEVMEGIPSHKPDLKGYISPRQYDKVLGKYKKGRPTCHSYKESISSVGCFGDYLEIDIPAQNGVWEGNSEGRP